jgi:TPP-dependent pyruvate/acetoin dehydrogenase alpha subunit
MDVLAVESATRSAVDRIRNGSGPELLEMRTYRFRGHSLADPELYRAKEEVQRWQIYDPIATFTNHLRESVKPKDSELAAVEADVRQEVEASEAFAETGPWEALDDLEKDVYSP